MCPAAIPPLAPAFPAAADANTTADNLDALLLFYDRFPEYRTRPLYLAGESYSGARGTVPGACGAGAAAPKQRGARRSGQGRVDKRRRRCAWHVPTLSPSPCVAGHYIPLLAQAILEYNSALPDGAEPIPLEGYAVGNGWTDPALDNKVRAG